MSVFLIIVLIISLVLLGAGGVFSVRCAVDITKIPSFDVDEDLKIAHGQITWASVASWVGIALILAIIVGYLFLVARSGGRLAYSTGSYFLYFLLFVLFILLITVGILAIACFVNLQNNEKYKMATGNTAGSNALIAAALALSLIVLIIIYFIYLAISTATSKPEVTVVEEKKSGIVPNLDYETLVKLAMANK